MKIASSILALLFLSFTIVQFNDPDPILWIIIYFAMVVVSVAAFFNKFSKLAMVVMAAGYLIYAFILIPGVIEWLNSSDRSLLFDDIAKMQHLYIEESREFLGLIICLSALSFYWLKSRSVAHKTF